MRSRGIGGVRVLLGIALALGVGSACRKRGEVSQPQRSAQAKPEETCDADGWCVQRFAGADKPDKALCAVHAVSATDVWAVGNSVAHWDGVRWTEVEGMPPHQPPPGGCLLNAIHGVSADAIWAIGGDLALFWDGKKLTRHAMPIRARDLFVTARDAAWVVGPSGSVARWDGRAWSQLPRPVELDLETVFCASNNDCWAAGYRGNAEPGDASTVLHFDGSQWREQRIGLPGIRALSGTAGDDVWAVGTWGKIFHYDGRGWSPSPSPAQRTLYEVHAAARDQVWALGEDGLIVRFDGKQWSAAQPIWPRLTSVTVAPSRELWTVNGKAILHWRGPTFRPKETLSKDLWDLDPLETQKQKERRELERYLKHLAEGRSATKAARYDAAAQAFTEALWAKPDDAQAFAERGYAAYLAKNFNDAQRDLEQAAKRAGDRKLRAQIFFNLGLVREARDEDGTSAFALSNFLKPTDAARKKLVGRDACALSVERGPKAVERTTYADWLAFHADALGHVYLEGTPTTSDDAKRLLCQRSGCEGAGPWVLTDHVSRGFLVAESKPGLVVATVARVEAIGMCPPVANAEIAHSSGQTLVVRATGGSGYGVTLCESRGSWHECSTEELEQINQGVPSLDWIRGCQWRGHTQYHVLDRATLTSTLTITQYDDLNEGLQESEQFRVNVTAGGIAIAGPGCRAHFPLSGDSASGN